MSHNSHKAAPQQPDNNELRKVHDPRDPDPPPTVSDPPAGTQLLPPPPPSRGDGEEA